MSRFNCFVASMAVMLSAGCTAALEETTESGAGAGTAQAGTAGSAAATTGALLARRSEEIEPTIVDIEDLAPSDTTGVVCRDMLKPASNVIVRYCLTPADWKQFEREQARWAQGIVRTLQGGSYR